VIGFLVTIQVKNKKKQVGFYRIDLLFYKRKEEK